VTESHLWSKRSILAAVVSRVLFSKLALGLHPLDALCDQRRVKRLDPTQISPLWFPDQRYVEINECLPVLLLRAVDCFVVFLRGIFADEHVVRRPLEIDLRRPSVRDEL
jgi:hypothetical protein